MSRLHEEATLQLAHSQVGCRVLAVADEAQGWEAAVLQPSSCLHAQLFWQITGVLHHVSVLLLVWAGRGAVKGWSADRLQQQVLVLETVAHT